MAPFLNTFLYDKFFTNDPCTNNQIRHTLKKHVFLVSLCLTIFQRDFKSIPETHIPLLLNIVMLIEYRLKMKIYLQYCYIKDSFN